MPKITLFAVLGCAAPMAAGTFTPVHVHELHATILWRLGLDRVNVTYLHNEPPERPTIVSGEVIRDVLA
jgi:hypothetical protein